MSQHTKRLGVLLAGALILIFLAWVAILVGRPSSLPNKGLEGDTHKLIYSGLYVREVDTIDASGKLVQRYILVPHSVPFYAAESAGSMPAVELYGSPCPGAIGFQLHLQRLESGESVLEADDDCDGNYEQRYILSPAHPKATVTIDQRVTEYCLSW